MRIFKSRYIVWGLLAVAVLLTPFFVHLSNPISFNQFLVQEIGMKYGTLSFEEVIDFTRSLYSSGINILSLNPVKKTPSLDNAQEVFEYIFSWIPTYVIVYPTEQFYYFSTIIDGKEVSGNIRVADLQKGVFSMVYFPIERAPEDPQFIAYRPVNGVDILINPINQNNFDVTYKEKTVRFKIPTYVNMEADIPLLEDEQFIGRIFDESGTGLFLMYNKGTNSFYEVLDEKRVTDNFESISENFVVGRRTGFVYYEDTDYKRRILVGINVHNAQANNFLDGPGDQVPIHINFKKELAWVYPSVLVGDGTDDYGVFLNKPSWSRFVIAPFYTYNKPQEVIIEKEVCLKEQNKSVLWTCLTKEWWYTPEWRQKMITSLKNEGKYDTLKEQGLIVEK